MRMIIILIFASLIFAKTYILTVEIETESIEQAGKVEKVILDKLKEYNPEITIKTKQEPANLYWNYTPDSLRFDYSYPIGKVIECDTLYRGKTNEFWSK